MGCGGSKAASAGSAPNAIIVVSPTHMLTHPASSDASGNSGGQDAGAPRKLPFAMCWDVKEKLGAGQFATVYRAVEKRPKDPSHPRIVAVKLMEKAKLTAEDLAALTTEVRAMRILSRHDGFVKMYEFYDEKDRFILVLELISGGELFDRVVQKERYSEREAREVIKQMTKAIQFAHENGVAHRDLKPENVLLRDREDDTSIKIADLGFAKIVTPEHPLMSTPCGTPGYVAPEILSGKPYGLHADIWSLGVIFYILLCGFPPFADDDQRRLFELIKAGAYTFDDPAWTAVSAPAKDLISRILVVDPRRRYTAREIMEHPWMCAAAESIPDVNLDATRQQLKKFNARRRFKKAAMGVRSTVRMKLLLAAKTAAAESSASSAASPGSPPGSGASSVGASPPAVLATVGSVEPRSPERSFL